MTDAGCYPVDATSPIPRYRCGAWGWLSCSRVDGSGEGSDRGRRGWTTGRGKARFPARSQTSRCARCWWRAAPDNPSGRLLPRVPHPTRPRRRHSRRGRPGAGPAAQPFGCPSQRLRWASPTRGRSRLDPSSAQRCNGRLPSAVRSRVPDSRHRPGPGLRDLPRAAIQICVVPRRDSLPVDQWLTSQGVTSATRTRYGTCDVLTPPGSDTRSLAYAQSTDRRAEIVTTITSAPSTAAQRRREVADALSSMSCPSS